ncbi:MAG: substrate-binding domain-containing protein, partial [Albidovulum sp.]|nr:substrate-binding domain-containing protein [Albidovulum sp.]
MNWNAITASALAAAMSISVAAQADTIKIGYAPSTWDPSDFHGMMGSGVESALDRAGADYEFFIRAPSSEAAQAEQLGIVEDYIAQGVDYVIINPIDVKVQRVTFEKVLEAGITLVVGNHSTPFPEEWGYQPTMLSGYSHK